MKRLLIFDVDGTLTLPRRPIEDDMLNCLNRIIDQLGDQVLTCFVSGSNEGKILEQLNAPSIDHVLRPKGHFDFACFENGTNVFGRDNKGGVVKLRSLSMLEVLGEAEYQRLVNHVLKLFGDLILPFKRGAFIELRRGNLNVSPCGRNVSYDERERFFEYDKANKVREMIRESILKNFSLLDCTIGGQISLDIFPKNWDKTLTVDFVTNHVNYPQRRLNNDPSPSATARTDSTVNDEVSFVDNSDWEIHFFGDRCQPGGNDYTVYTDPRVSHPHAVASPQDTMDILNSLH